MSGFSKILEFCKHFPGAIAAVGIVLSALFWIVEPRLDEYLVSRLAGNISGPCVSFPITGHRTVPAGPGEWSVIFWNDLVKLRDDCGTPDVTGTLTNGGGLYHRSELSIDGVVFPMGTFSLRYGFKIDERVEPGEGRFRVTVTYPDAVGGAPPAISPWVPLTILKPDQ